VALGLVVLGCALSGKGIVEVSDGNNSDNVAVVMSPLWCSERHWEDMVLAMREALDDRDDLETVTCFAVSEACNDSVARRLLGVPILWLESLCSSTGQLSYCATQVVLDEHLLCPDCGLYLSRARFAQQDSVRVAGALERAKGGGQASAGLEGAVDGGINRGDSGDGCEIRPRSSYWCVGDSTGRYCPVSEGGNATSSGTSVHIGTVACRASETALHRRFTVDGFPGEWECEDTGGPAIEVDGYMDFWARDLDEALRFLPQGETVCVRWLP